MRFGLAEKTIDKINTVFSGHPAIEKAVLYGSRAKGNYRPGSDIDLTLYGDALASSELDEIITELDELLLPYRVDLSIFDAINHAKLREHIDRMGVVFYQRADVGEGQGAAMKAGWEEKSVGEILQLEYGKPLDASDRIPDGRYPVYGANGQIGRTNKFYYDKPSIIVGRKGSAGEINLSEEKFWPLDVTYFVTFDEQRYDLRFVFYLLTTLELPKLAKGVKPGINRNDVYSQVTKAPPLPEQQRIVAILDEAFAGIATARANAEQNRQNARALFESHLQSVFTQRGEGWEEKKLGDTSIVKIIDGDRGSNYPSKEDFSDEGFCLFLNTKNVRPDGFNFDTTMFVTEEKDKALRKGKLQRQDVILTTRGTIGNVAIFDEDVEFENIRINSGMLIFRPNTDKILPSFLFEIFRSGIMKSQMTRHVSGAAQPQLPIKTLIDFEIPVPNTLESQRKIVASVREINAETQHLESLYQQKLAALDDLKKSLLHQAFSGQL